MRKSISWRTVVVTVLGHLLLVSVLFGIPLAFRTFLFQSFSIPSAAMEPTLFVGDYLFVSKFSYGYSHYALPFSPRIFSGRFFASEPQRGDVVIFRLPKDDSVDFIKRVIGLPGDRIQMIGGQLNINGEQVKRQRLQDFVGTDRDGSTVRVRRWRLTLPNGVTYDALDLVDRGFYDDTQVYQVPAGHYFMMGDNLDNSTDSRVLSQVGYIPAENLIGRAGMIFYSVMPGSRARKPQMRPERIGRVVR